MSPLRLVWYLWFEYFWIGITIRSPPYCVLETKKLYENGFRFLAIWRLQEKEKKYSLCPKNIVRFLESLKNPILTLHISKWNDRTWLKFSITVVSIKNYYASKFEASPSIRFWDMVFQSWSFFNFLETVQYFWDRGSRTYGDYAVQYETVVSTKQANEEIWKLHGRH